MRRFLLALALFVSSCGPVPPAQPVHVVPGPTPTPVSTFDIVACAAAPIDGACQSPITNAVVDVDTHPGTHKQFSNSDGYTIWTMPDSEASIYIDAPGYVRYDSGTVRIANFPSHAVYTLTQDFVPLPRLVKNGRFFGLENGERFTVIGASDFNLLARFEDGEDIESILTQRAAIGFNYLRVWTYYDLNGTPPIGRLIPSEHPDFYQRVPAFLRACARHGLYVELTAYVMPATSDPTHWMRLNDAVRPETNPLVELVNENDQHPFDLTPFAKPQGVLASHGSNGAGSEPIFDHWDYAVFHTNGMFEWWRKVGHNAMEQAENLPVISDENTRYVDNDDSLAHAFDAAASAALLAAGSTFHSQSGKPSVLWAGAELEAAKAWAAGAHSVPLGCQAGPYAHRQDLEGTTYLRVYERPVAGLDCIVRIRP